jgi:hypothetical protein
VVPAEEECDQPREANMISLALGFSTTTEDRGRQRCDGGAGMSATAGEHGRLQVCAWWLA